MRLFAKVFLIVSTAITFVALLVIITLKFQFTDSNFWIDVFRKGEVYQSLETNIQASVQSAFGSEEATPQEGAIVSGIFTESVIKDIVERNTKNVFDYVNGKEQEVIVYFPIDKMPEDIRASLQINSSSISLDYLLTTFGSGSAPIGGEFFTLIRSINGYLNTAIVITIISLLITFVLMYRLEEKGKRLLNTCLAFACSGGTGLILIFAGSLWIGSTAQSLHDQGEPVQKILASILPPSAHEVFYLWSIVSVISIVLGLLSLLFFRGKLTPIIPNMSGKSLAQQKAKK